MTSKDFRKMIAESRLNKIKARKHFINIIKMFGEYQIDENRYFVVLKEFNAKNQVRLSYFDERGFYTHDTFDSMELLIESLVNDYACVYANVKECQGILDGLSNTDTWKRGTYASFLTHLWSVLCFHNRRDEAVLLNEYTYNHGIENTYALVEQFSLTHDLNKILNISNVSNL